MVVVVVVIVYSNSYVLSTQFCIVVLLQLSALPVLKTNLVTLMKHWSDYYLLPSTTVLCCHGHLSPLVLVVAGHCYMVFLPTTTQKS